MVLAAFVYFMLFQTYGHVAFSALTLLVGTIRYDTIRYEMLFQRALESRHESA